MHPSGVNTPESKGLKCPWWPTSACRDYLPPAVSEAWARSVAAELYGIEGSFEPLSGERDKIFRIATQGEVRYVLKIANAAETQATLEFQNKVLQQIEGLDPLLPVPRVCESLSGRRLEMKLHNDESYYVRLLTFVPGVPIRGQPASSMLLRNVGGTLARLDKALGQLATAAPSHELVWDVTQALSLRPLIAVIEDEDRRTRVRTVFDALEERVFPTLGQLQTQIIHNDFNPKNVLIDLSAPDSVSGIIDFGDMVAAAKVVDLGVAAARHLNSRDPVASALHLVSGYHAVVPLEPREIEVLFWLICTRLAMRAVIWSWRLTVRDPRADPNEIEHAFHLLGHMLERGARAVTESFYVACDEH